VSLTINSVSAFGTQLSPIPSVSLSVSLESVLLQTADLNQMPFWVLSEVDKVMGVLDSGDDC